MNLFSTLIGEELDAFFAEWLDDTHRPERIQDDGLVVP
jgi:hypothetical protein